MLSIIRHVGGVLVVTRQTVRRQQLLYADASKQSIATLFGWLHVRGYAAVWRPTSNTLRQVSVERMSKCVSITAAHSISSILRLYLLPYGFAAATLYSTLLFVPIQVAFFLHSALTSFHLICAETPSTSLVLLLANSSQINCIVCFYHLLLLFCTPKQLCFAEIPGCYILRICVLCTTFVVAAAAFGEFLASASSICLPTPTSIISFRHLSSCLSHSNTFNFMPTSLHTRRHDLALVPGIMSLPNFAAAQLLQKMQQ